MYPSQQEFRDGYPPKMNRELAGKVNAFTPPPVPKSSRTVLIYIFRDSLRAPPSYVNATCTHCPLGVMICPVRSLLQNLYPIFPAASTVKWGVESTAPLVLSLRLASVSCAPRLFTGSRQNHRDSECIPVKPTALPYSVSMVQSLFPENDHAFQPSGDEYSVGFAALFAGPNIPVFPVPDKSYTFDESARENDAGSLGSQSTMFCCVPGLFGTLLWTTSTLSSPSSVPYILISDAAARSRNDVVLPADVSLFQMIRMYLYACVALTLYLVYVLSLPELLVTLRMSVHVVPSSLPTNTAIPGKRSSPYVFCGLISTCDTLTPIGANI